MRLPGPPILPTPCLRSRSRGGEEGGWSLVELLLSTVAIVTLIGALISMIQQQVRLRRQTLERYMAYDACVNTMEDLRALPFSQVAAVDGSGFDVTDLEGNPGGLEARPGDPDGLPGLINVTIDQTSGGETLYLVTLDVSWRGAADADANYRMQSLLGERKVQ